MTRPSGSAVPTFRKSFTANFRFAEIRKEMFNKVARENAIKILNLERRSK